MLVYRYTGCQEEEDREAFEYDRKLDAIRESLEPFLIKSICSIGDYPIAYERDVNYSVTRACNPQAFQDVGIDWCVPLVKNYTWPGSGADFVVYPELGGVEPPALYIHYYHVVPELRELLLSADSFRSWNYPNFPQDPCFFNNKECWFISTVHEGIYDIVKGGSEEVHAMDELGVEFDQCDDSEERVWTIP